MQRQPHTPKRRAQIPPARRLVRPNPPVRPVRTKLPPMRSR
jgi:hypothetical protein